MATLAVRPQKQATVASKAETCITSFQQCLHKAASVHARELSLVEDQLARFSLWSGNIRVFGSSRQSLDHRLREAPEIRDTFIALLEAIIYRIETCTSSLEALSPQHADDALTAVDKGFQDALGGIADQISLLHKLSNTIRRASKESQNLEAAGAFRIRDDDGNDAEDFLRLLFAYYVRDRFPTTSEAIQQRLAGTMVLRRKRILYRRQRYGSMPIRVLDVPSQPDVKMPLARLTAQPQKAGAQPDTGDLRSRTRRTVKSLAQSATTLAADKFYKASAPSAVSVSRTIALGSHEELVFPPAPTGAIMSKQRQLVQQREDTLRQRFGAQDLAANPKDRTPAQDWEEAVEAVGEVTCPFCFYALPASAIVDGEKWKQHVITDLDAYVCLFEQCESPEELFSHSSQWLKHMREHAQRWRCTSKSHEEFLSITRAEYIEHLKTTHGSRLTDAQLRVLADKSARTIGPLFKSCPLCGTEETRGSMEEHVVGHLRLLAIKSLPAYEDEGSGDPENASKSASGPRSRSTVQDFMNTHSQADNASWGTPSTAPSNLDNSTTGSNQHDDSQVHVIMDDPPADDGHPGSILTLNPDCAICTLPAEAKCDCEAVAFETTVRQAETRMMERVYGDIRGWVRGHALGEIEKRFRAATAAYYDPNAHKEVDNGLGEIEKRFRAATTAYNDPTAHKEVDNGLGEIEKRFRAATTAYNDPNAHREVDNVLGDVSEPTPAATKRKINELWCETVATFPETLEYFFSLVELSLPTADQPELRDLPLRGVLKPAEQEARDKIAAESQADDEKKKQDAELATAAEAAAKATFEAKALAAAWAAQRSGEF